MVKTIEAIIRENLLTVGTPVEENDEAEPDLLDV